MSDEEKTLGYCPLCMQNVEHTRRFSSIFTRLLDLLTLGLSRIFRLGPYYCFQCENKTLYLRPVRREAPTFDSTTSVVNFSDPKYDRRQARQPQPDPIESQDSFESVGNFIKSEHSLVMQDRRASNFSQKFRDGAVSKILSGKSSLHEVQRELGITETDLVRWIAELLKRKDQRIDELEKILEAIQTQLPVRLSILDSDAASEGPVVEGRISNQ